MSIAENIKQYRKKRGITQKQLAEKTGLAVITIQQYEAGKYNPKMNAITQLCIALDCKITDLIDDESKKYYRYFDVPTEPLRQTSNDVINPIEEVNKYLSNFYGLSSESKEFKLLNHFRKLNNSGKEESIKRVEELTEIPRYTAPDHSTEVSLQSTKDGRKYFAVAAHNDHITEPGELEKVQKDVELLKRPDKEE